MKKYLEIKSKISSSSLVPIKHSNSLLNSLLKTTKEIFNDFYEANIDIKDSVINKIPSEELQRLIIKNIIERNLTDLTNLTNLIDLSNKLIEYIPLFSKDNYWILIMKMIDENDRRR